jgi:hypothetical protein
MDIQGIRQAGSCEPQRESGGKKLMGIFGSLFGNNNTAMWTAFGIAKPMLEGAKNATMALGYKYKDLIAPEQRDATAIALTGMFVQLYMAIFTWRFSNEYGQVKLPKAQAILFQVVAHEYQKMFSSNLPPYQELLPKFMEGYEAIAELCSDCKDESAMISTFAVMVARYTFKSSDESLMRFIYGGASTGIPNEAFATKFPELAARV